MTILKGGLSWPDMARLEGGLSWPDGRVDYHDHTEGWTIMAMRGRWAIMTILNVDYHGHTGKWVIISFEHRRHEDDLPD